MSPLSLIADALSAGQKAVDVRSQNKANALVPGYNGRDVSFVTGTQGKGVEVRLTRCFSPEVLKKTAQACSVYNKADLVLRYTQKIQTIFGSAVDSLTMDGSGSYTLTNTLNAFIQSLKELQGTTDKAACLPQVIRSADALAKKYNALDSGIEGCVREADHEIDAALTDLNSLLRQYGECVRLIGNNAIAPHAFGYADQRDSLFAQISTYLGIIKPENDGLFQHLACPNGLSLVTPDQTAHLVREGGDIVLVHGNLRHTIHPNLGKLGGLLEVRNTVLPNLQEVVDQMALILKEEVNALHNQGTAYQPSAHLVSERPLPPTMDLRGFTGMLRVGVIDHANGHVSGLRDIDLTGIDTIEALMNELNALDDVRCVSTRDDHLELLTVNQEDGPHGIAFRAMGEDEAEIQSAQGLLAHLGFQSFFMAETNSKAPPKGTAATIRVNAALLDNHYLLAHALLSDIRDLEVGGLGTQVGDFANLDALASRLEQAMDFDAVGGLGARSVSLSTYGALVGEHLSQVSRMRGDGFEIAQKQLESAQKSWKETSAVDPVKELLKMQQEVKYVREMSASYRLWKEANETILGLFR